MKAQGSVGFGTLILFIAAVITAVLAAYVITNATVAAQSKAAMVAQDAREKAGTTVEFVRVMGYVNNTTNSINSFVLYVRLAPGSSPINLSQTPLVFIGPAGQEVFYYGTGYTLNLSMSYDASGRLSQGLLGPGDVAAIQVNVANGLGPSQVWRFMLLPPNGQPSQIYGITPNALLNQVEVLY